MYADILNVNFFPQLIILLLGICARFGAKKVHFKGFKLWRKHDNLVKKYELSLFACTKLKMLREVRNISRGRTLVCP